MATFNRIDAGRAALTSERADGYLLNCLRGTSYTRAATIIRTVRRQALATSYRPNRGANGALVTIKPTS